MTNSGMYVCSRVHLTGVHNWDEESVCHSSNPGNNMGCYLHSNMDSNTQTEHLSLTIYLIIKERSKLRAYANMLNFWGYSTMKES